MFGSKCVCITCETWFIIHITKLIYICGVRWTAVIRKAISSHTQSSRVLSPLRDKPLTYLYTPYVRTSLTKLQTNLIVRSCLKKYRYLDYVGHREPVGKLPSWETQDGWSSAFAFQARAQFLTKVMIRATRQQSDSITSQHTQTIRGEPTTLITL